MKKEILGYTKDNQEIIAYTIQGTTGLAARVMNYGANLLNLWVLDQNGNQTDVVLGYEHIEDYLVNAPAFGCCITPCCNRIKDAAYQLNGISYLCDKNDGNNNLHSGFHPMHHKVWDVLEVSEESITFRAFKQDGEMGFPGNLEVRVTYSITEDNGLQIKYWGLSDNDTIFNPTNHSYFRLSGERKNTILDEVAWLDADYITWMDEEAIPDGSLYAVENTPLDFHIPKPLGRDIMQEDFLPLKWGGAGYNHNYVLKGVDLSKSIGYLYEPDNGIKMEIYTDLPGVQLYTANYLNEQGVGKNGKTYGKYAAVCFETQYFPNAINIPTFEQPVLKAGVAKETTTIYKFMIS